MTGPVTGIRRRRAVAGRRETPHLPPDRDFYGQTLYKYEEFVLALYYHYGIEVEKDEALALNLFKSSAKQGCDEAEKFLKNRTLV